MSANGLDVFDRTLETTHIWLNEICDELGPDKHLAWKVLSVVLQKLRDRLPLPLAAHLGAQLPLLVRGVYYDQFEPGRLPSERKGREEFVADVFEGLSGTRPINADQAIRCVFRLLSRHISEGQVRKICDALPKSVRQLWDLNVAPPPEPGREESREVPEQRERLEEPLTLTHAQEV